MAKKVNKLDDIKKLMIDLNSTRKSLLNLRFQKATGQLEKTSDIKKTRKKIHFFHPIRKSRVSTFYP